LDLPHSTEIFVGKRIDIKKAPTVTVVNPQNAGEDGGELQVPAVSPPPAAFRGGRGSCHWAGSVFPPFIDIQITDITFTLESSFYGIFGVRSSSVAFRAFMQIPYAKNQDPRLFGSLFWGFRTTPIQCIWITHI
jgi:hypothetical protein